MKTTITWIKQHPFLTAGGVVALILLYLVIRARASSGSEASAGGPSEAFQLQQYAAQTQRIGVQAQADLQGSAIGAALAAKQVEAATMLQLASLERDLKVQQIDAQERLGNYELQNQASAIQLGAQVQREAISVGGRIQELAIAAQQSVALGQSKDQMNVALAGIGAQKEVNLSQISAGLKLGLDTNATNLAIVTNTNQRDIDIATLATQLGMYVSDNELEAFKYGTDASVVINAQNLSSVNYLGTLEAQTNQLAIQRGFELGIDTNATNLAITGSNNAVQSRFIDMLGLVSLEGIWAEERTTNNLINTSAAIATNQMNQNYGINQQILQMVNAGTLNHTLETSVVLTMLGGGAVAQTALQQSGANDRATAGMFSNIFGGIFGGLGSLFTGGFGGGATAPVPLNV